MVHTDDDDTEEETTSDEEEEPWADSMSSPPPGSANASEPASPAPSFHSPQNNFLDPLVQQLERVQLRMEEEQEVEAEAGKSLRTTQNAQRSTTYLQNGCSH